MKFTDVEIVANDYTVFELRTGKITLATHIKNVLDTNVFPMYEDAINSVMSPEDDHSLMAYLIFYQRYEDCAMLKRMWKEIIIKPRGYLL